MTSPISGTTSNMSAWRTNDRSIAETDGVAAAPLCGSDATCTYSEPHGSSSPWLAPSTQALLSKHQRDASSEFVANQRASAAQEHEMADVEICRRVADIPGNVFGFQHHWLRTPNVEAGMGPANGAVPSHAGQAKDSPYISETAVTDHTGQGMLPESICESISDAGPEIDRNCVEEKLTIGRDTGSWHLLNQCQTFVAEVLHDCEVQESNLDEGLNTAGADD